MENIKTIGLALSALTLGLALSACDGSGKAPAVQTGQLVDAAVQGATYKATPSGLSGVTDVNGNYQYQAGDKVVFSFGNIVFPEVTATGTVTPQALAGVDGNDFDSQTVKNIARFLQSLDANGDPSDGIVIDPTKVEGVDNLDFTQDASDFEDDFKEAFPTDSLVTTEDAIAHLQCELTGENCKTPVVDSLPDALAGKSFDLYFSVGKLVNDAPYSSGRKLTFAISTEGVMTINEVASQNAKSAPSAVAVSVTVSTYEKVGEEYKWTDTSGGYSYTASLFQGALNEINVSKISDGVFKGQFTATDPNACQTKSSAQKSTASIACNF